MEKQDEEYKPPDNQLVIHNLFHDNPGLLRFSLKGLQHYDNELPKAISTSNH